MRPVVLIAEGETLFRQVITLELQDRGLTVIEAVDHKEVMERIRMDLPALMILDVDFPGSGAVGLLERLQRKKHAFPIIVLAESCDAKTMKKLLAFGVKECVVKSEVEWEALVKKILKYMEIPKGRAPHQSPACAGSGAGQALPSY
ncbi:response regulator [Candidatus Peregrinibacteria bacterium]|nr:response regulator [Candidatus Peregrinibacteria bacterium]